MASASGEAKQDRGFLGISTVPLCGQQNEVCNLAGYDMHARVLNYISDGHGSSLGNVPDGWICADVALDGFEKFHDNAAFSELGSLSISGACDASSHSEVGPSRFDAIMSVCSSNGNRCISARSDIDSSDDGDWSVCFGNADARHREVQNRNDELSEDSSFNSSVVDDVKKVIDSCSNETQQAYEAQEPTSDKPSKRAFCKRCEKAQDLCICSRFKGVVWNRVKVTILQNPKEKQHAVGSVRVALLGLENIALVNVPEIYTKESFRVRPKVPGSKRCLAGRGGKKLLRNGGKPPLLPYNKVPSEVEVLQVRDLLMEIFKCQLDDHRILALSKLTSHVPEDVHALCDCDLRPLEGRMCYVSENRGSNKHLKEDSNDTHNGALAIQDSESLIPPGVALLFPSDKAIELSESFHSNKEQQAEAPSHLLVLDGTWSKARRIYFENPWLQKLPHYKLSPPSPSLYEGVRKQPKPGCLSTLESIVYALKVLEPDKMEGLNGLLEVFDSMVADQRRCKQMKVGSWSVKATSGDTDFKDTNTHSRE